MGRRAYLMVDVADNIGHDEFAAVLRELEKIQGADFIDSVFGFCDLVIMVESPASIRTLINRVRMMPEIKNLKVLRIVSVFQHRRAREKQFSRVLNHSGF